jgi:hypothetical protein
MFFGKKKRQLAQAMDLIAQFQITLVETVNDWKTTVADFEETVALLVEASQQRDQAVATADAANALLLNAIKEVSGLVEQKQVLERRLRIGLVKKG